ncbi:MAG: hypothetical protein L0338_36095 [Acidobacteria bacterium]|nr:hypothetical protein [Acidobacteriota bacterium]
MSDILRIRPFAGNLDEGAGGRERTDAAPFLGKRRLVEECEVISVWVVQRAFAKKVLIASIREARPFQLPVPGGYFDVWFTDEPHRLPGRVERWSSLEDGNARLWLICPRCRRKRAMLFYFVLEGSTRLSDLWCEECHRLSHLSTNSAGRKWYVEVGRPIRKLLRQRDRLEGLKKTPRVQARLARIDAQLQLLLNRLKPKTSARRRILRTLGGKRTYKDVTLLGVDLQPRHTVL